MANMLDPTCRLSDQGSGNGRIICVMRKSEH